MKYSPVVRPEGGRGFCRMMLPLDTIPVEAQASSPSRKKSLFRKPSSAAHKPSVLPGDYDETPY